MAPYCTLQSAVSGTARMVAPEVRCRLLSMRRPAGVRDDQQLLAVVGNLGRVGEVVARADQRSARFRRATMIDEHLGRTAPLKTPK